MERDDCPHIPDAFSGRLALEQRLWSPSHQTAWEAMVAAIHERKGGMAILGKTGSGKTTLVRAFMASVDQQYVQIIYIADTKITFLPLLTSIYHALGCDVHTDFISGLLNRLHHMLVNAYKTNRNVVLILDNAHNFSMTTFANLGLLTQLKLGNVHLIQVVLLGHPTLAERLNRHTATSLKPHMAVYATLASPVTDEATPSVQQREGRTTTPKMSRLMPAARYLLVQHVRDIPQTLHRLATLVRTEAAFLCAKLPSSRMTHVLTDAGGHRPSRGVQWTMADLARLLPRIEAAIATGRSRGHQAVQYMLQHARGRFIMPPRRWDTVGKVVLASWEILLSYARSKTGMGENGKRRSSRGFLWALAGAAGLLCVVSLLGYGLRAPKDAPPSDMAEIAAPPTPVAPADLDAAVAKAPAPTQTATAGEARSVIEQLRGRWGRGVTTPTTVQRGELIRMLQGRLKATGFVPGPIDGILGPQTRQALRQFQEARGLNATGELSPTTRKALGL